MDVMLVPYGVKPGSERERNFQFVIDWYKPLGLTVYLGCVNTAGKFNRAASRNAAAAHGPWDRALIADADCVADLNVVKAAFEIASRTGHLILPHNDFYRLNRLGTERVIGDKSLLSARKLVALTGETRVRTASMPSGALVLTHETWDKIGGYDERLKGWGYEDSEFLRDAALRGVYDLREDRLPGPLMHLWHPKETGTIEDRTADRLVAAKRHVAPRRPREYHISHDDNAS